jgi:hypothetical protein
MKTILYHPLFINP